LNATILANPFVAVAALLIGLAAALVVAYKTSETFRTIVNGAFDAVKGVAVEVIGWFTGSFIPFFTTTIPGAFNSLWAQASAIFIGIHNTVTAKAIEVRDGVVNRVTPLRDTALSIAHSLWSGLNGVWSRIAATAGAAWGGVVDAIAGRLNQGIGAVEIFARTIASAINSMSSAVGLGNLVGAINLTRVPHFASGGTMDKTGLAVVGEKGPELRLLPGGTKVFSNEESVKMLLQQMGLAVGGPIDKGRALGAKVTNIASTVFEAIVKGPETLVKESFARFAPKLSGVGVLDAIDPALIKKFTDAMIELVKGAFERLGGIGDAIAGFAGPMIGGWVRPLARYVVTQLFGPSSGLGYSFHTGIDLAVPGGTPIFAARAGRTAGAGWMGGYGNAVRLDHGAGWGIL
jgi:phage-related protein